MKTIYTKIGRFAMPLQCGALALALIATCSAQDAHQHATQSQQNEALADQTADNTLVKVIRTATEKFKDVKVAEANGYTLQFGCVTGPDDGAMGLHYVNSDLVSKGILDPTRPQIIIYEPMPNGDKKMIGVDFLLIAADWNAKYAATPMLMGQIFHYWEAPNRFGLPAFYTLHVWAWKNNPKGAFTNWHPNVNCQSFAGQ